ncbi:MAG: hypothetical protein ACYDD7_18475 [Acidimicrobiales bacterium]
MIGTTWIVRGRPSSTSSAVTTTAGRTKPGSLPAGTPKSTSTTSPARIVADRLRAHLEPGSFLDIELGRRQRVTDPTLPLGSDQSRDLFVERDAIIRGEVPQVVPGSSSQPDSSGILHIDQYVIFVGTIMQTIRPALTRREL